MNLLRSAQNFCLMLSLVTAFQPAQAETGELTLPAVVRASFERIPELALSGVMQQEGQVIRRQASSLLAGDPSFLLRHKNDAVARDDRYRQ